MNATARTRIEYLDAAKDFMEAVPLVGDHTVGDLVIQVGHKAWAVRSTKTRWEERGNNRTPLGLRTAVRAAIERYAKTCINH